MVLASKIEKPSDVEYNLEACGDFGGCPHRARCATLGRQTLGIVSSLFLNPEDRQMDTTDPLAALLAARRPINPPDGTPEMELPPPAEVEAQQELGDLEPEQTTTKRRAMRLPGIPDDDGQDVLMTRASKSALVTFAQQNKILVEAPEGRSKPGTREYRAAIEAYLEFVDEPVVDTPTPVEVAVIDIPLDESEPTMTPVVEVEVIAERTHTLVPHGVKGAFVLYINACPRGQVTFLEDILAPLAQEVEKDSGVSHYLLLDYNTGPKKVAAVLAHRIRSGQVELAGPIVADMRLPASEPAVEVLLPFANDVVRKF